MPRCMPHIPCRWSSILYYIIICYCEQGHALYLFITSVHCTIEADHGDLLVEFPASTVTTITRLLHP